MSEEKKLDEKPTSVPRSGVRKRPVHSPLMEEVTKRRREADRVDARIVAEANHVWGEIVMPEEADAYIGPVEDGKKGREDV